MSEPINANPKILSLEDLPTRNVQYPSLAGKGLSLSAPPTALDSVLPSYEYDTMLLPLDQVPELSEDDGSSAADEEDDQFADADVDEEPIDEQEIYDLIATISDPEHPVTLGQLAVVNKPDIFISSPRGPNRITQVTIDITPTITHCSLATLIGLGIRVRLERCLPSRYRVVINVKKGTHQSESQVNRQLNDKERVAAACENQQLVSVLSGMLATCQ
ncbi:uncharacterized protein V1516DRAFT_687550 [Lipomyces oligophaga]|uniref:uncharacterized protein n=1 Tax=Lipomyces oligophaga TaxID=45792 RepID=UPI0034CD055F